MSVLDAPIQTLARLQPMEITGRVAALRGLAVLVRDLPVPVGSLVAIRRPARHGGTPADPWSDPDSQGEVVGFDGQHAMVMMLCSTSGITPGDRVVAMHAAQTVPVGDSLVGRCINGLGRPIDSLGPIHDTYPRRLDPEPISPLQRRRVTEPIYTGVRAIDLFATLGRGQRMGVFAGPGVGKSTLLGCVARNSSSDLSVIALVGERGREVGDFIEHTLGPQGLARSVVVVATGDESPLMRIRAALVAAAVAEHFRDQGKAVLLIMDSITRFAHAQRQIGLSVGEPPATRGYTPSVFAALSRLLERAGAVGREAGIQGSRDRTGLDSLPPRCPDPTPSGSITGLYSILVEGDDMTEPIADATRGILDGHLILSRGLAQRAHYPAIDILDSVSRVADDVCEPVHVAARRQIVRLIAAYRKVEDLVQIGAYAKGSSPESDTAIAYQTRINELLLQTPAEREPFEQSRGRLTKMAIEAGAALARKG